MSFNLVKLLTPAPVVLPDYYDGIEYRWKSLTFRPAREYPSNASLILDMCLIIGPPVFKLEAIFLAVVLTYVLAYYLGKWYNDNLAHKWFVIIQVPFRPYTYAI